jgi:hypothetical protein
MFEDLQQLLVKGDFISPRHQYRKLQGITYEYYHLFGQWKYFSLEVCSEKMDPPKGPFEETTEADSDALFLIQ